MVIHAHLTTKFPPINCCSSIRTGGSLFSIGWRLARPCAIFLAFFCFCHLLVPELLPFDGPWAFCHFLASELFAICWPLSIFSLAFLRTAVVPRFASVSLYGRQCKSDPAWSIKIARLAVQATGPPWVGCIAFCFSLPFCAYCLCCFFFSFQFGFFIPA